MEADIKTIEASVAVAAEALAEAAESMPKYAHPFLAKDFTQHQLYAMVVLRRFMKTDIKSLIKVLSDSPDLIEALRIEKIPDYATLFHAEERLVRQGFVEKS